MYCFWVVQMKIAYLSNIWTEQLYYKQNVSFVNVSSLLFAFGNLTLLKVHSFNVQIVIL